MRRDEDEGLRRRDFGDPLKILIDREERSCKGCKFEHTENIFGKNYTVCLKLTKSGKRRNHGKKCIEFKEAE